MNLKDGAKVVEARSRAAWRDWLQKNHTKETKVWLVMYHRDSQKKSIYYSDAVEEALCFGWIDSVKHKRDEESAFQYFSKRKPSGKWSKLNRERVEKLIGQKLMTPAGQQMIDLAKEKGTWLALEDAHPDQLPDDLKKRFNKNKKALANFKAFPPSSRRMILEWILNAKRPDTRKNRIDETVQLAAKNIRAHHPQPKAIKK